MTDALLVHQGSARQALVAAEEKGTLPTCKRAFYGKLSRLPLPLSVAFMTEASRRLNELLPTQTNPLPASLHDYPVRIIDGKKTKHIAKKLKWTQPLAGQLFGAKLLAAYDPATRLIQTMSAHADGERNDAPLVPDLLANARAQSNGKRAINVADAHIATWCKSRSIASKTSILPCAIILGCIFTPTLRPRDAKAPMPRVGT